MIRNLWDTDFSRRQKSFRYIYMYIFIPELLNVRKNSILMLIIYLFWGQKGAQRLICPLSLNSHSLCYLITFMAQHLCLTWFLGMLCFPPSYHRTPWIAAIYLPLFVSRLWSPWWQGRCVLFLYSSWHNKEQLESALPSLAPINSLAIPTHLSQDRMCIWSANTALKGDC